MTKIHPMAVVDPRAEIGADVEIGPFCVVEAGARIGDGCLLHSNVVVHAGTVLGARNRVFHGAALGGAPQHIKVMPETGVTTIGDGNTIRENVTVHSAMEPGHATQIGDYNLLMVNSHVAHDCRVGNHCVFVNNAALAGHVSVEDRAFMSGGALVHQFCRIGKLAIVGGMARIIKDVPPFVTIDGGTSLVVGLNLIGLRRAGLDHRDISQLKEAYRLIYRSGLPWVEMLAQLEQRFTSGPAAEFNRFFGGPTKRGFSPARRGAVASTWEIRDDEGQPPQSKVG